MKIYTKTIRLISLPIIFLVIIFIGVELDFFAEKYNASTMPDVIIGLLSGLVVTLLMTLITYLHQKEQFFNKLNFNLLSVYHVLYFSKELTGYFVSTIETDSLKFDLVQGRLNDANKSLENLNIDEFDCVFKSKPFDITFDLIREFKRKFYYICETSTNIKILKTELELYEATLERILLGDTKVKATKEDLMQKISKQEGSLSNKISRFHEFQNDMHTELNEKISILHKCWKYSSNWQTDKRLIEDSVDKIINEYKEKEHYKALSATSTGLA